ncbi:MAG TPA: CoA transferase [Candidatus Binataceae bacterium]
MNAPLHGLHVLDLSWVMVGPLSGRYLSDLGADVIKVESRSRIDPLRTLGPFKDGKPGPERSISYHNLNAGKRSLAINMKEERGREIILRLAGWADVVLESFTPGVLENLKLDYHNLKQRNPNLIMVSTSILGQTGPHALGTSGVGTMGAAMSGATFLLGWPDRPPCGPFGPWTDGVAPRFIVSSILAALHNRSRTGHGTYIDVAQAETGLYFMSPAYYEYAANGSIPARRGDAGSPLRAPHGIYPCAGDDRWVAIDASRAGHWKAFRAVVGGALLDPRFDTLIARLRNRGELDAAISDWTRPQEANAVEQRVQAVGAPCHIVSRGEDLARDPHLVAAGHLRKIDDPVFGAAEIEGPRFRLHRTPHVETRRAPLIGEHTREILESICNFSEAEIAHLTEAGVLG